MATKRMQAAKCPTDALALTNKVFCAPGFFPADVKHVRISPITSGGNFLYSIAENSDVVSGHAFLYSLLHALPSHPILRPSL